MANILIADTDEGIRQVIADSIQDFGHTLYLVEDGNEALELIRNNQIHVVLADRELPGKDGMELLVEIKRTRPNIPVILITGIGEEDTDDIIDAGAFATLSKPFNVQEVRRIINETVPLSLQALTQITPQSDMPVVEEKPKPNKLPWIIAGASALLLILGLATWLILRSRGPAPVRVFTVPYSNLSGMAATDRFFWCCDWFNQSIYKHNLDAILSLNRTFSKEDWHPTAIAWDGKNIWSCSSWGKRLTRHKMDNILSSDMDFESPVQEPSALYYDGKFFWICDMKEAKIVKFSIDSDQIKIAESFNSPGQKPIGIYKDKKFLWTADSRSGLIYKHSTDQNFKVLEVYSLPEEIQKLKISCFTSDGKAFFVGTEKGQRIYELHPGNLKLVGSSE